MRPVFFRAYDDTPFNKGGFMKKVVGSFVAVAALSGCAMGWDRANTTEDQFRRDLYSCQQEAARSYPSYMQSNGGGYRAPDRTTCMQNGAQMNCTTTPGAYTPPSQSDVNAIARAQSADSCMYARGYVYRRK